MLDTAWAGISFIPPTPLDIATLENAIVSQLGSQINSIEIAHYPDRPESYRLTHRVGAALVRYDGAAYGDLIDTAAVVQKRTLRFAVRLMMRDLGWSYGGDAGGPSPGAYALLEAIRGALTGFQIGGCTKMYPLKDQFLERDKEGGVWIYESIFAFTTAAVEPSTIDNFPLLIEAVTQEQGGQTLRVVAAAQLVFNAAGEIKLGNANISEVIVSAAPTGAPYTLGTDYTVDSVNGIVVWLPTGSIPPEATVSVGYSYAEVVIAVATGGQSPTAPTN
ncbi:MAG TPA: Gp37 family protein [Candidatus Binataceae bacterium]|nr:Gp37 family protein [Candidatus Binataceae bacterium]